MGLFTKLGRQVEQFKREVDTAAAENAEYECIACGEPLAIARKTCPNCGAEEVAARDPENESG